MSLLNAPKTDLILRPWPGAYLGAVLRAIVILTVTAGGYYPQRY